MKKLISAVKLIFVLSALALFTIAASSCSLVGDEDESGTFVSTTGGTTKSYLFSSGSYFKLHNYQRFTLGSKTIIYDYDELSGYYYGSIKESGAVTLKIQRKANSLTDEYVQEKISNSTSSTVTFTNLDFTMELLSSVETKIGTITNDGKYFTIDLTTYTKD